MILRNVGKVESSKDLSNEGLEDVLAIFEARGFVDRFHGAGYWTKKSEGRGKIVSAPAARFIHELAKQSRYNLEALVLRFSENRTDVVEELLPREAWLLTEMLKSSNERETRRRDTPITAHRPTPQAPQPGLFGDTRVTVPLVAAAPAPEHLPAPTPEEEEDVPF